MNKVISKSRKSIVISVIAILSVPIISGCLVDSRLLSQTAEPQVPFVQAELPENTIIIPKVEPIPRPVGLLGDGGLIIFSSAPDLLCATFCFATQFANPDGSGDPLVTWRYLSGPDSWSPDGNSFIYISGSSIYRVAADGTGYKQIIDTATVAEPHMTMSNPTALEISPDGKYIAYSDYRREGCSFGPLVIVSTDGNDIHYVSDSNWCNDYSWSPDSSRLVFTETYDPTNESLLFIFDLRSGSRTELTPLVFDQIDSVLQWWPDDSAIAFSRRVLDPPTNIDYLIDPDGSNMRRCAFECSGVLSPDGSRVAFVGENYQLFIENNNDANSTQISHFEGRVTEIRWSPDGKYLVVNIYDATDYNVYVISADGKSYWPIANNPDYDEILIGWLP